MSDLIERCELLKEKIEILSKSDKDFKLFGSLNHQYKLNEVLPEKEIAEFEQTYSILLPDDYRCYLLNIGNGGVGPYYGIEKLNDSLFEDLDYKNINYKTNPSKPFLHSSAWNLNSDDFNSHEEFEKTYFSEQHSSGILRLCNYGCGITINLVVNGAEYGNMWADDRGSDNGIIPWLEDNKNNIERFNFLSWYEYWLDKSLKELKI